MNNIEKKTLVKLISRKVKQKLNESMNPDLKGGAKRFASKLDPKLQNALKSVLPQLQDIISTTGDLDQKVDIAMMLLQNFGFGIPELEAIRTKLSGKIQKLARDEEEPGLEPGLEPEEEPMSEAYDVWVEKVTSVSGADTLSKKLVSTAGGALQRIAKVMPPLVQKQTPAVKVDLALQTIEALLGIKPDELAGNISRFTARTKQYAKQGGGTTGKAQAPAAPSPGAAPVK